MIFKLLLDSKFAID